LTDSPKGDDGMRKISTWTLILLWVAIVLAVQTLHDGGF
jgi:hypothetical protein